MGKQRRIRNNGYHDGNTDETHRQGPTEKKELSADKKTVTLFKEGVFYKCYNEDAVVFGF